MRSIRHRLPWLLVAVFISVILIGSLFFRGSVKVVVTNKGSWPMEHVIVVVSERGWTEIGDIPAGATRSVRVRPTIDFNDVVLMYGYAGESRTVKLDCHVTSGASGSIEVDIQDRKVIRKVDNIGRK